MNPSPLSIGVVMILFGAFSSAFAVQIFGRPGWLCVATSLLVAAGGLGLVLRKAFAFWVAMASGVLVACLGAWGIAHRLPVGPALPYQPAIILVAGLYICARVAIARFGLGPRPPRQSIVDELHLDETAPNPDPDAKKDPPA